MIAETIDDTCAMARRRTLAYPAFVSTRASEAL
jgi:hypothetical protein